MQNSQKNNYISKYKKALKDAIDEEGKKIFTDGEIEKLTNEAKDLEQLVEYLEGVLNSHEKKMSI